MMRNLEDRKENRKQQILSYRPILRIGLGMNDQKTTRTKYEQKRLLTIQALHNVTHPAQ